MDASSWPPSRAWMTRAAVIIVILLLLTPSAISAATYEPTDLQRGTITDPANGSTVVAIQGFHFDGQGSTKKPARLVSIGSRGDLNWDYRGGQTGATWFYDVDPLDNGNLLVVSTKPGHTLVYELNPKTRERVWVEEFDLEDTHDVDLINGDQLLVANMRNWDNESKVSNDRVFIYDRSEGEIVWEWYFKEHYPESTDGGYNEDWSHVNDVDKIGEGRYLVSPRNFDQAIVINRSTKEIEMRVGEDGNHGMLNEQHNPDYLESEDGTPTVLVADSENDRIVEYAREDGEWVRTWTMGEGQLNWPRDADRLPNGNTLITDTLNHRVIEVTPTGEIVWEYYATWGPYDAERPTSGDGSTGPTIRDLGASGDYQLSGSAALKPGTGDRVSFANQVTSTFVGTPVENQARWFAAKWAHVTPWIRPVWMSGWDFFGAVLALLVLVGWGVGEAVYNRRRIRRRVGRLVN